MSSDTEKYISYSLGFLIILVLAYFKFSMHELWKDEWQAWFVAKDLHVMDLLKFLYYEGHPALWYLFLKPFTWISGSIHDELLIKMAHFITVMAGLYVLFVKFKMPLILKLLAVLSYFVFFEYGIVNRGYFLVIALYFWLVTQVRNENYNNTSFGIGLLLLCQTEVYGVFMALCLGFYMFLITTDKTLFWQKKWFKWGLGGLILFIISVFPRSSDHLSRVAYKKFEFFDKIWVAFQGNISNTYLLGSTRDTQAFGWTWIGILLSLMTLAAMVWIFRKNKALLGSMIMYIGGAWIFSWLFMMGGVRHWGMGFIFLLGLVELLQVTFSKDKIQIGIISIFCFMSVIHGYKATKTVWEIPFTNAKETGLFIKNKVPAKVPVVSLNKFESVPVSGYAERKFYELPDGEAFSFFRWVDKIYVPTENELKLFAQFKGVGGIVLLAPKPIDSNRYPNAKLWQTFNDTNYKNENYYLYTLAVK